MIQVVVTEYNMDHSNISLHLTEVAGSGSLQAVQIGHADEVWWHGNCPTSALLLLTWLTLLMQPADMHHLNGNSCCLACPAALCQGTVHTSILVQNKKGNTAQYQTLSLAESLQGSANAWLSMQNLSGATWTAVMAFFGNTPFDLRLTDMLGQTLILRYTPIHLHFSLSCTAL